MSVSSYQRAQKVTESPRQTEYRLFAQITREMIAARDNNAPANEMADALHRNRELWSTLAGDCGAQGNGLPPDLRANIISISIWVNRHTTDVIRGVQSIDDLIEVNRNVMEGLALQPTPTDHLEAA